MQKEYDALVNNDTWNLVLLPTKQKAIECKRVFRMKLLSSTLLDNYKSMGCTLGYLKEVGVDFYKTFSPVIKPLTIRVVLSLTLNFGWELR